MYFLLQLRVLHESSGMENNMKQNKNLLKSLLALAIVVLIAAVMFMAYNQFKPKAVQGSKEITVQIIVPEEETKEIVLHSDAEYLREALEEENLVKGSESDYGLFITEVNGRTANDANQEWWCITKGGEDVFTGVDTTPISDGEQYEITLTVGY